MSLQGCLLLAVLCALSFKPPEKKKRNGSYTKSHSSIIAIRFTKKGGDGGKRGDGGGGDGGWKTERVEVERGKAVGAGRLPVSIVTDVTSVYCWRVRER
jgi:hypothetical protein